MLTHSIKVLIFSSGQNRPDPLLSLLAKETAFELSYFQNGKLNGSALKEKTPDILLIDLSATDPAALEFMKEVKSLSLNVPLGFLGNQAQIDLINARAKIWEEKLSFLNKAALPFDL